MFNNKRLGFGLTVLLTVFTTGNFAAAAESTSTGRQQSMNGTVNYIDSHQHKLIVNDCSYSLAQDLQVITPGGKDGRLALLYPGKRIRMLVDSSASSDNDAGVIYKIYMLK